MPSKNKVSCPTCGHSVNRYKMTLTKQMVQAMRNVYMWCGENKRHEFVRKEVGHVIHTDTQTGNFGQLVYFGGIMYKRGKGHWGMNMKRAKEFFRGEKAINTVAWKDPLTGEVELSEPHFVHQVKGISELLDKDFMFVPEYEELEFGETETV